MKTIEPIQIEQYSKIDFLETDKPYRFLYEYEDDKFTQERLLSSVCEIAKKAGVKNFKKLFLEFQRQVNHTDIIYGENVTNFEGQEIELKTGNWQTSEYGITTETAFGKVQACPHPILPVQRLFNIDYGIEKIKIAYRKGKAWRHTIVDKKTIASNNGILELANCGVAVTSENAKFLVRYLHDVESINYESIPENNCVSRLGWIEHEGFSPYVENLMFDGEANNKEMFESVSPHGSYEKWLEMALKVRKGTITSRLILASSFASVLINPLGLLPFFAHLWGQESGTGKTVALMLAASVWANPEKGKFWHTFNGTAVGMELSAEFVNSLPLVLDEFQLVKNKQDFEASVYMLAEGVGRTRGAKSGGLKRTPTWRNCILTSGEMPITNFVTGAGAFNRILEVECKEKIFDNPFEILEVIKSNYGHAGKAFLELIQSKEETDWMEYIKALYNANFKEFVNRETTDKQAAIGALLHTVDFLLGKFIFEDDVCLTKEEIEPFLHTKVEVDIGQRAYDYLCEYCVQNKSHFMGDSEVTEVWGKITESQIAIVKNQFKKICEEQGYSSQAVISWLNSKKLLIATNPPHLDKPVKINGISIRCIVFKMDIQYSDNENEDIPDYNF